MKYQEVRQPLLVLPAYRARNQQRRCQRPLRNYSCPSHQQDIADGHIDMLPSFSGRFRMFQITPRCMKYMNYYLTICIWNINMNCMKYMKCIEYMKCMNAWNAWNAWNEGMILSSHQSSLKPLKSLRRICQSRKAGAYVCCARDEAHPLNVCSFLHDWRFLHAGFLHQANAGASWFMPCRSLVHSGTAFLTHLHDGINAVGLYGWKASERYCK